MSGIGEVTVSFVNDQGGVSDGPRWVRLPEPQETQIQTFSKENDQRTLPPHLQKEWRTIVGAAVSNFD